MGLVDAAHDRQSQARAAARPRSVAAGEALEGVRGELGREAVALVGHVDLQHAVVAPSAELHRAGPVAECVVGEVSQRLTEPEGIQPRLQPGRRRHPQFAALRSRAVGEALPGLVEERGTLTVSACTGKRSSVARATRKQVLGQLGQVVGLVQRGA